jgi:25S rRNA (cytosine2278-C5)-methyltransferase
MEELRGSGSGPSSTHTSPPATHLAKASTSQPPLQGKMIKNKATKRPLSKGSNCAGSNHRSPYEQSANIVGQLIKYNHASDTRNNANATVKQLVYHKTTGELLVSKSVYAQVCQVLKFEIVLSKLVQMATKKKIFSTSSGEVRNHGLLYVLLYELLLGPYQSIRGGGALKRLLLKHETSLRAELQRILPGDSNDPRISGNGDPHPLLFPRYIRLNAWTLATREQRLAVVLELRQQLKDQCGDPSASTVFVDPHIPDLLVLPPNSTGKLMSNDAIRQRINGKTTGSKDAEIAPLDLILQDKSSCFPAFCLAHGFDDAADLNSGCTSFDYLDACAAPGNKTSHLAAVLLQQRRILAARSGNKSKKRSKRTPVAHCSLYAFDRSRPRYELLERRLSQMLPSNKEIKVVPQNLDFLATRASDYPNVRAILLDPSCSGSGIFSSIDRQNESQMHDDAAGNGDDPAVPADEAKQSVVGASASKAIDRIEQLSSFQVKALQHAMGEFPNVTRIVYSTCSIHAAENEEVIRRALNRGAVNEEPNTVTTDKSTNHEWCVVSPQCLGPLSWPRRGVPTEGLTREETDCMIRADRGDETNGFFVCCLQKLPNRQPGESVATAIAPGTVMDQYDLPVYSGEYSTVQPKANARGTSIPDLAKSKPKEKAKRDERRDKPSLPKKIMKKLAWKTRQRDQKHMRERNKGKAKAKTSNSESPV